MRRLSLVAALIGIVFAPSLALALDPAYLGEMPEPRAVAQDIAGHDRLDTLARQAAALSIVRGLIKEMAGTRYYAGVYPTPDEQRILDAYSAESGRVYDEAKSIYDPAGENAFGPRRAWEKRRYDYASDPQFRDRVLERHFSAEFRELRLSTIAALQGRVRQHQAAQAEQAARESGTGRGGSKWSRMSADERVSAVAAGLSLLFLLGLGWIRERRPSGFAGDDFRSYRVGFRRYRIDWATGALTNYDAQKETQSTSWEQYDAATHTTKRGGTSRTTLRERFDVDGERESGELYVAHVDLTKNSERTRGEGSFAASAGHHLTVVWARRRYKKAGLYVGFRDRTTGRTVDHPATGVALRRLLASRKWTLLPAFLLGLFAWSWIGGVAGFVAFVIVPIPWIVLLARWTSRRCARFTDVDLPQLWRHIESRA